jgi:hypothetical protein
VTFRAVVQAESTKAASKLEAMIRAICFIISLSRHYEAACEGGLVAAGRASIQACGRPYSLEGWAAEVWPIRECATEPTWIDFVPVGTAVLSRPTTVATIVASLEKESSLPPPGEDFCFRSAFYLHSTVSGRLGTAVPTRLAWIERLRADSRSEGDLCKLNVERWMLNVLPPFSLSVTFRSAKLLRAAGMAAPQNVSFCWPTLRSNRHRESPHFSAR